MTAGCWVLSATLLLSSGAVSTRINLVDFGQVVRFAGLKEGRPEGRPIERGPDGWEAWKSDDCQYMIGVEWDEPRELAEVNIEFRHAIANREKIEVQYWAETRSKTQPADSDERGGRWVTAQIADWWAGDRDVSFSFKPASQDEPGSGAPNVTWRRTRHLRFLLGKSDLPPVRYIRSYGPAKSAQGTFAIRLEAGSDLRSPIDVDVVNGYLLEDGNTSAQSTQVNSPAELRIRYAPGATGDPNRTRVTLSNGGEPSGTFLPIQVVKQGTARLERIGVVVEYKRASSQTASRPSGLE